MTRHTQHWHGARSVAGPVDEGGCCAGEAEWGRDHCPACRVARELREHRDQTAGEWHQRRAVLNFAIVLAERACPDYRPATPEEPTV